MGVSATAHPLEVAWRALGHRVAAATGAVAALMALLSHVPLSQACVRGGLAWAAALATVAAARWLLVRVVPPEVEPVQEKPPSSDEFQPEEERVSTLKAPDETGR